jgi:DNA-binding ferritin-like protein
MKKAGLYVAHLFLAREMAHRAHLRTTGPGSFAAHSALGDFYEAVVPLADSFAEACQGEYQELLDIPLLDNEYEGEIADVLEQIKAWIQDNQDDITGKDQRALGNLVDEAVALFQSTLYKLRFLE